MFYFIWTLHHFEFHGIKASHYTESFSKKQFSLGLYLAKFIFFGLSLDFERSKAQLKLIHPNTTPKWTVIGLEYFGRDVERKLKNDQRNEA